MRALVKTCASWFEHYDYNFFLNTTTLVFGLSISLQLEKRHTLGMSCKQLILIQALVATSTTRTADLRTTLVLLQNSPNILRNCCFVITKLNTSGLYTCKICDVVPIGLSMLTLPNSQFCVILFRGWSHFSTLDQLSEIRKWPYTLKIQHSKPIIRPHF